MKPASLLCAVVTALALCRATSVAVGDDTVARQGENRAEESSVAKGLKWLAKQQEADGSWSFTQGGFANPGRYRSKTGATALALLPFLGAGQTHTEGEYKSTVRKGLDFLVKQMKHTPQGGDLRGEGAQMRWHGIATVVLCEAYGMTRDKRLHKPAQEAVNYICAMQDAASGGWPPKSGEKPCTTVTAWQVMALKSAHMAYLQVSPVVVKRVFGFLTAVQAEGGAKYGETNPRDVNDASTAAGLLCRIYLGWKHSEPALKKGVVHLSGVGPSKVDVSLNHFGQQVLWHWGGRDWSKWNRAMRRQIVETQVVDGGEAGSWFNPDDVHAADGGRLFQTALNTMILEVYYRHMPIYRKQAVEDEFQPGPSSAMPNTVEILDRAQPLDFRDTDQPFDTETYDRIDENPFRSVWRTPLSTFSIDVDTASYANVRRFLNRGELPPKDAVRIEEFVNYFSYDYAPPTDDVPFSTHVEVAGCPWSEKHRLVRIGIKGREIAQVERPAANLVFLLDVSGSMDEPNKLPLVKAAMKMLVQNLAARDHVAIVVYAGASGLVLPSTSCANKHAIVDALGQLAAGGSTNGGEGIQLAYRVAAENFVRDGVNRVILCTDGDFNIGVTSQGELTRLIEEKAASGVFLTVLGFGMGNYKDSTLEKLADCGNGNYGYVDTIHEARKMLVEQLSGTLVTIAKDVKIQVEFNPARVGAYRLIGYENRILAAKDFDDDKKDAGEIGAGHTVTALYELVPAKRKPEAAEPEPLRYQTAASLTKAARSDEIFTLKLRYKQPDGKKSELLALPVADSGRPLADASQDFRFAAAVAGFGMLLRDSPHKGNASYDMVVELARSATGDDPNGYRTELLRLVKLAKALPRTDP